MQASPDREGASISNGMAWLRPMVKEVYQCLNKMFCSGMCCHTKAGHTHRFLHHALHHRWANLLPRLLQSDSRLGSYQNTQTVAASDWMQLLFDNFLPGYFDSSIKLCWAGVSRQGHTPSDFGLLHQQLAEILKCTAGKQNTEGFSP